MTQIGTPNNAERTFDRNDLALSSFVRRIPNVRTHDVDMQIWTEHYEQCMIIFEATSTKGVKNLVPLWKTAKALGAYSIFLVHEYHDDDHTQPVKITVWDEEGKCVIKPSVCTWEELEDVIEQIKAQYK